MNEPFASIADIKSRVAKAFADDQPAHACPYPMGSEARTVWLSEYAALSNSVRGRVAA